MTTNIASATWASTDKTSIRVIHADGSILFVPPDPANRDYAALIAAGETIADYVAPPPPVPLSVAMWQAQAALQAQGLLDKANAAVAALNDQVVATFWAHATDINRSSPTLARLATALGLTDAQIDALFVAAAKISL